MPFRTYDGSSQVCRGPLSPGIGSLMPETGPLLLKRAPDQSWAFRRVIIPLWPEMGPIMPDLRPLSQQVGISELKASSGVGSAKPDFVLFLFCFLLNVDPCKKHGPNSYRPVFH